MNLKEAFRYQNKLQSFLDEAQAILNRDENITKVEKTYLRHKVMPEAQDETVLVAAETEYSDRITDVARFLVWLLGEKERLFTAIRAAKAALPVDMDSEVSLNATRQSLARTFKHMSDLRSSEQTLSNGGTGYRFNADGNQVSYKCDVRRVTTINYDRNVIRRELQKLYRAADEMSAQLDLCLVTSKVDYEPPFDVNVSFSEAFETFAGA
jgi:hypothetical protein